MKGKRGIFVAVVLAGDGCIVSDAMSSVSCVVFQGQWGVTAEQEAEEKKRIQEFQETIPKMRSQLRILTHFYQVPARATT